MKTGLNFYTGKSLTQMTHVVGQILKGNFVPPADRGHGERRFAIMEVTDYLMTLHDQCRDDTLQLTIRSWIGRIQDKENLLGN